MTFSFLLQLRRSNCLLKKDTQCSASCTYDLYCGSTTLFYPNRWTMWTQMTEQCTLYRLANMDLCELKVYTINTIGGLQMLLKTETLKGWGRVRVWKGFRDGITFEVGNHPCVQLISGMVVPCLWGWIRQPKTMSTYWMKWSTSPVMLFLQSRIIGIIVFG